MGLTLCCSRGICIRTLGEIPVLRETLVQLPCSMFVAQQRMKAHTRVCWVDFEEEEKKKALVCKVSNRPVVENWFAFLLVTVIVYSVLF